VIGDAADARRHAQQLIALERHGHVFVEAGVQDRLAEVPGLLPALGLFYVFAHLTVTVAVLVWLYVRRPAVYARVRTTLAIASFGALAVFAVFPAMPPRLAAAGVTDAVSRLTPVDLGSTLLGRLYDPYAALPSMHVGYALVVGFVLARHARGRAVRVVGAVYPALALVAVVATGNHYLVDAVAGAAMVGVAYAAERTGRHASGRNQSVTATHPPTTRIVVGATIDANAPAST
jgi:PAP2 superfamily